MYRRAGIICYAASSLAFPDPVRIYQLLRSRFFWGGMRADCIHTCSRLFPPQVERARFKRPPYLYPTEKGSKPFQIWSVDSLPNLSPAALNGATSVIVAVDMFTKWVELAALLELNSFYTAQFLHDDIICRYGVPTIVRTDGGSEYNGKFAAYCRSLGVVKRMTAALNPGANGQVERMNAVIKEGVRKCTAACPGGRWWEFLSDIARSVRLLPARSTQVSPYVLVYKQYPEVPIEGQVHALDGASLEECVAKGGENMDETVAYWGYVFDEIRRRLKNNDLRMEQEHARQIDLAR